MDAQQSVYVDKYQRAVLTGRDPDEDELFAELEDELEKDNFMSSYREERLQQLSSEFKAIQSSRVNVDGKFGNVKTLSDEKEVIQETIENRHTVIHFYKEDFMTCSTMDSKLAQLSLKHLSTNFLRVDVVKSPFLVTKLNVKVLPCVLIYINGVERDRIIGFERLGSSNGSDFPMSKLEDLLYNVGVINRKSTNYGNLKYKITKDARDDDDDSDLDL